MAGGRLTSVIRSQLGLNTPAIPLRPLEMMSFPFGLSLSQLFRIHQFVLQPPQRQLPDGQSCDDGGDAGDDEGEGRAPELSEGAHYERA